MLIYDGETVLGAGRSCKVFKLNPMKIIRDKEGKPTPSYNPIIANCGNCIHYVRDREGECPALKKYLVVKKYLTNV